MTKEDKKNNLSRKDKSAISLITILASCFAWIRTMLLLIASFVSGKAAEWG